MAIMAAILLVMAPPEVIFSIFIAMAITGIIAEYVYTMNRSERKCAAKGEGNE